MSNKTFSERLNNPGVVRVYAHMIKTSETSVVTELRNNLREHAKDHPKMELLEPLFTERLGTE